MWQRRSWRASVASLALALVVGLAPARVVAQDNWQRLYVAGEEAFKKHDYKVAESKLRAALAAPGVPAPKNRGPRTPLGSLQFGFIPEYYLAVICSETGRLPEALIFAGAADQYLEDKEKIATLKSIETTGTKAVPLAPNDPGKTTAPQPEVVTPPKPPADPSAQAATAIQTALLANKLSEAISLRDEARKANARGDAFNAASHAVDLRDFEVSMAKANQELQDGHYPAARQAADHAGQLGIDFSKVTELVTRISKLEQQASAPPAGASSTARGGKPLVTGPTNPVTPPSLPPTAPNPAIVEAQRRGLRALLLGDYQGALGALQSAAFDPSAPRTRFYLACAEAGLSLLEPDSGKKSGLEADARRDWQAVAANRQTFTADLAYISPAILRTLGISPN